MRKSNKLGALIFATAFAAAGSALAASPQPAKEIAAAAQHAGLAAQGGSIEEVHTHLHHTINCLVGPDGKGFAPKEMNPCAQLGMGAIPDTADAGQKKSLEAALEIANAGIADADIAKAKANAAAAQSALAAIK